MIITKEAKPPPDPSFILRAHEKDVSALLLANDDSLLISGDVEGNIVIWNLSTRRPIIPLWKAHDAGILNLGIVILKKRKFLLSHGRDYRIRFWDFEEIIHNQIKSSPVAIDYIEVNSLNFCRVSIRQHGRGFGSNDETAILALPNTTDSSMIDIFDAGMRQFITRRITPSSRIVGGTAKNNKIGLCMCLHLFKYETEHVKDMLLLAAGFEDGSISMFNAMNGEELVQCIVHTAPVLAINISNDGKNVYSGSADNMIIKLKLSLNLETKNLFLLVKDHQVELKTPGISDLKLRNDGRIIAASCWDSQVRLFGAKSLKRLAVLDYHQEGVASLSFSSNSNLLLMGSKAGRISIWNIY